ncbi:hypothetical protein AB6D12_00375 [Vibrio cyclitrophicus]
MSYEFSDGMRDFGDMVDAAEAWLDGNMSARDSFEAIGNEMEDMWEGITEDIDAEDERWGGNDLGDLS